MDMMDDLFLVPVYAAMLVATIAGQFLGIVACAVVLRSHSVWVPLVCSLLLEAAVAAQYGASRLGHALTERERRLISGTYSLGLALISPLLVAWLQVARGGVSVPGPVTVLVVIALALAYTALRYLLMGLFGRRAA